MDCRNIFKPLYHLLTKIFFNFAPVTSDQKGYKAKRSYAHVAELVDVQVSEACGSCPVGVRLSPCAPL